MFYIIEFVRFENKGRNKGQQLLWRTLFEWVRSVFNVCKYIIYVYGSAAGSDSCTFGGRRFILLF